MPAYISHAIMGEQLYESATGDEELFKIPISKDELKGYCLGTDLASLSKATTKDPQNYHTRAFFLNMLKHIKENRYLENINVMSLLYGHIAHYFLDINTHPLINYIESKCKKVGVISTHNMIEGYLSSYLSTHILGKDIMEIKPNYFNRTDLSNPDASKLLNTIYGKLYGDYNIIKSYKKTMNLLSIMETLTKNGILTKEKLKKVSKFAKFLKKNNLTLSDLTNEQHNVYKNNFTEEQHNESFIELYNKSIEMTLEAICLVNKYLYSTGSIAMLETVFKDLSYDTGAPCTPSKRLIYVKK